MRTKLLQVLSVVLVLSVLLPLMSAAAYKEAPELAELVKAGKLPPVEERLPEEPMLVEPVEEIGVYGGTWKFFGDGGRRIQNVAIFTDVGLIRWSRDQSKSVPCVAKGWESAPDGKEFTIFLRKGLKWSDGEPFTADDILFWFEDVIMNDELYPVKPKWMISGGEVGIVEKIDDFAVKFKFKNPHGMFILFLTKQMDTYAPEHYMKQFHPKYTALEDLEARAKKEGFDNWIALFTYKMDDSRTTRMNNPDIPSLYPWIPTVEPPAERFIFKRNPYFFAVDTEGNQLPYIDQVDMRIVDPEVMNLKIIAGETNFQASRAQAFKDYSLYMENAEEQGYEVLMWGDLQISEAALWPNLNTANKGLADLYHQKTFRQALSIGIDREAINQTIYKGFGYPTAATLGPVESRYYREEYARAYTEYDPDRANKMLDDLGITERDGEGYRLRSDGKRLTIVIEPPNTRLGMIDNLQMIKDHWKELGIELIIKPQNMALWNTRMPTGQMDMTGWPMGKAASETDLVPIDTNADWGPLYGLYYATGGKEGVPPTPEIKELQDAWSEILVTVDETRKDELYHKILGSQAENVWVIGVVGPVPKPLIKKNTFRNVLPDGVWSYHHGHFIGCTEPYQFFIEKGAQ